MRREIAESWKKRGDRMEEGLGQPGTRPARLTYPIGIAGWPGGVMSLLKRLFGKSEPPKQRIRVCVECGMPLAEHKDWCSIRRAQAEMKARAQSVGTS